MSRWAVDTIAVGLTLLVFVVALIVTVHLTGGDKPGPLQTCGTAGIYKVIPAGDDNNLTVICENGRSYYP